MHLTLKKEATPAARDFLRQQARFDKFIEVFNNQRPHEALNMKCPIEIYQPCTRPYTGLPDIDCPFHDKTIVVTRCGRICLGPSCRGVCQQRVTAVPEPRFCQ
jgi:putative transposase